MTEAAHLTKIITRVVNRAPDWLRTDLLSKDATVRTAAEETLAVMIANAVQASVQPTVA